MRANVNYSPFIPELNSGQAIYHSPLSKLWEFYSSIYICAFF